MLKEAAEEGAEGDRTQGREGTAEKGAAEAVCMWRELTHRTAREDSLLLRFPWGTKRLSTK